MKISYVGTIRGLWDELNQGLFPWIDDNIGELAERGFTDRWFVDIPAETVSYDSAPVKVRSRASDGRIARRRIVRKPSRATHFTKHHANVPHERRQALCPPRSDGVLKLPLTKGYENVMSQSWA